MSGLSDYFKPHELWSSDDHVVKLDPRFEDALLFLRETLDIPFFPNSCCRSLAHNDFVGGHPKSLHLYEGVNDGRLGTMAIDLRVRNDAERGKIISKAWEYGWSIGIYKTFIHLDRRFDLYKDQKMFWGGY